MFPWQQCRVIYMGGSRISYRTEWMGARCCCKDGVGQEHSMPVQAVAWGRFLLPVKGGYLGREGSLGAGAKRGSSPATTAIPCQAWHLAQTQPRARAVQGALGLVLCPGQSGTAAAVSAEKQGGEGVTALPSPGSAPGWLCYL